MDIISESLGGKKEEKKLNAVYSEGVNRTACGG